MGWAGHVARMLASRGAYGVLVRRPEGMRPLGKPRHGWEGNIKMGLQEVEWRAWTASGWGQVAGCSECW
jgi:hypothetical protein